ncbi:uncharacterized protein LOC119665585 [Teleopsis dalmanni]|uniref:uncharacterized protein LOC119665585 n=1 Tax=Teleopsis dalmanni TaxID=139649 RepID=UPI0018CF7BB4|nr:uncharacterized protein LOC119665585 [Teleopsis dalmanni]
MARVRLLFSVLSQKCFVNCTIETSTEADEKSVYNETTTATTFTAVAEKLVRFRRQPSITIVKHVSRSTKRTKPRWHIKKPKLKYGPPNYSYGEPISYFKPEQPVTDFESPPTFSMHDFEHINLDAADFQLPPSSYDTQPMDLDFYSQMDDSLDIPKEKYTHFQTEPEKPSYLYAPPKTEFNLPRVPHKAYGVPNQYDYNTDISTDFDTIFEGQHPSPTIDTNYSPPQVTNGQPFKINKGTAYDFKPTNSYEEDKVYQSPPIENTPPKFLENTKYMPSVTVAEKYVPIPIQTGYKTNTDSQQKYATGSSSDFKGEHKKHNFNENSFNTADIEITYSPSFEINIPPKDNHYPSSSYGSSDTTQHQPGNFAEPPAASPPSYQAPEHVDIPFQPTAPQPQPGPSEDYVPPSQELPLNPNHKQPAYDFPKSSYEVPIYDPIPFDASNNEEQEVYPPHLQDGSFSVSNPSTIKDTKPFVDEYQPEQSETVSNELDRTNFNTELDINATEKSTRPRRYHKRKQSNSRNKSSSKHTLDVPELKKAFEAENQEKLHHTRSNDSKGVEITHKNKQHYVFNGESNAPQIWNPMRIRTSQRINFTPTTVSIVNDKTSSTNRPRYRTRHNPQARLPPQTTTTTTEKTKQTSQKPTIISIEKSRSKSYYDGTIAPPVVNITNSYNPRVNKFSIQTRTPLVVRPSKDQLPKRTTKSVFDTTYFKSPIFEKDMTWTLNKSQQNIPKNHKLY